MLSEDGVYALCEEKDCSNKIKNHAWGRVKSGWLELKDGRVYCPDHVPDWYKKWKR